MALVREGEARAFAVIVDRHASAAFSLAYRMCGTRAMAQDVVQEAFLSLWRSRARYDRTRGSVRSWVLSIARNRTIDAFRRTASTTGTVRAMIGSPRSRRLSDGHCGRSARGRPTGPHSAGDHSRGPAAGDRARVLRGFHPQRDRRVARSAIRHRQGSDASRAREAVRFASSVGGCITAHSGEPEQGRCDPGPLTPNLTHQPPPSTTARASTSIREPRRSAAVRVAVISSSRSAMSCASLRALWRARAVAQPRATVRSSLSSSAGERRITEGHQRPTGIASCRCAGMSQISPGGHARMPCQVRDRDRSNPQALDGSGDPETRAPARPHRRRGGTARGKRDRVRGDPVAGVRRERGAVFPS